MPSYSKTITIGHLVRPTEVTFAASSGMALLKNAIAVNRKRKGKEDKVSFIDFTAFDKNAESINTYFNKGDAILLEGPFDQQRWETDSGEKRSKITINVERWAFVGNKTETDAPKQTTVNEDDIPF